MHANDADHETVRPVKQSWYGTHGSLMVLWWLCVSCNDETGNFNF